MSWRRWICSAPTKAGRSASSMAVARTSKRRFFEAEVSDHSQAREEPMSAKTRTMWTFAITSVAVFMATLDNLVVTTALPVIRKDLHATLASLEWTVNAYTLTFAVLLLTGAAFGDRFGRRRMFVVGLAIFTVSSA